jgi:hypothetical protein
MTSKRKHIDKTLELLCAAVPASAGLGLERCKESLPYTAPELLDSLWLRIYTILTSRSGGSPVWANQARDIWNKAAVEYTKI